MKAELIPETQMSPQEKQVLRKKLDDFYKNVTDYSAFSTISNKKIYWEKVEEEIRRQTKKDSISVLEIGSGRSGFGEFLVEKGLRNKVLYVAQDVTMQNAAWLESQANRFVYGDISTITDDNYFDIIFSTYVLEHVTDPSSHLDHVYRLLKSKGTLFIFCPRYDLPGYFCPSSRHLNWLTRSLFGFRWASARISSLVSRRPAFLIQTDLAAFYQPFYADSDAVHWVSLLDLELWAQSKHATFQELTIGVPPIGSKDWLLKRFLTVAVRICKNP